MDLFDQLVFDTFNKTSFITKTVKSNLKETDENFQLEIIVPGYKKEDFNISVEDFNLTVSVNNIDKNYDKYEWADYKLKKFKQVYKLHNSSDTKNIYSKYENGILYIIIKKQSEYKKMIEVE